MDKRKATSNYFLSAGRRVAEFISNRFLVSGLIIVMSICFANTSAAVVIPSENIDCTFDGITRYPAGLQYDLSGWRLSPLITGADLFAYRYNAISFYYPQGGYIQFKEGDNVEWLYRRLEDQYRFLDVMLYKLTGGNYFLGSVWNPFWHGFSRFYCIDDLRNHFAALPLANVSDYIVTPYNNIPVSQLAYHGDRFGADMSSVPEPSSILLFGLAALGCFILRRKPNWAPCL